MAKSGVKKTQKKIKSKIQAIKNINSNPKKTVNDYYELMEDDIKDQKDVIKRKIDDFKIKRKAKKTEKTNILENLLMTVEGFLDTSKQDNESNDKPRLQKKLVRYSKKSAVTTLHSTNQIIMDAVQNNFFAGDGVCGSNNLMSLDSINLSPKEFDFLDMLKISPYSNMGSIMYESDIDKGLIKMNREFFDRFDLPNSPYNFQATNGLDLFNIQWDDSIQKYNINNIPTDMTVSNFIKNYYSRIEPFDLETLIKQSMLMTIMGDDSLPESFLNKLDFLNRMLDKIFSFCDSKKGEGLNQNNTNLIGDDEIDSEWYFDFDDAEGIDLDDEDARHRRVLKFKDCNNFEIPIDASHIEDFIYLISTNKVNIEDTISTTLNAIATESYEESGRSFSIDDFEISLTFKYILNIAKAIAAGILSPKYMFPIVLIYKTIKGQDLNATEILKRLRKLFLQIIKGVFWKFLQELWRYIKKDLEEFLLTTISRIKKNKLNRYKKILTALLKLLKQLLKGGFQNCDELYESILNLIELSLGVPSKIPMPVMLLALSDKLPGYSTDRAYMNVVQRLEAAGIDMEPIYGVDNKTHDLVKSIIEGNQEEIDDNSYVKISLKNAIAPSGPSGTVISNIITGAGKLF